MSVTLVDCGLHKRGSVLYRGKFIVLTIPDQWIIPYNPHTDYIHWGLVIIWDRQTDTWRLRLIAVGCKWTEIYFSWLCACLTWTARYLVFTFEPQKLSYIEFLLCSFGVRTNRLRQTEREREGGGERPTLLHSSILGIFVLGKHNQRHVLL